MKLTTLAPTDSESRSALSNLSRRERQILELLYQHGPQNVSQIRAAIPNPPTYSGVRALLRTLGAKGHIAHNQVGSRYVYRPVECQDRAGERVVEHILATYFHSSPIGLLDVLINKSKRCAAPECLRKMRRLIDAKIADLNTDSTEL